jgi:hypothetical protein
MQPLMNADETYIIHNGGLVACHTFVSDGESLCTNRLQKQRSPAVHAKDAAHKQSYEPHYRL